MPDEPRDAAVPLPKEVEVRWLTPENTRIYEGEFGMLHCDVNGETYRGIHAVLMFPVRHPNRYVSIRYSNEAGAEEEVGIIPDLGKFPDEQQRLLHVKLGKHYYEQVILRIHEVQSEYGLLFFDVETQRGREQFVMPWRRACTEDYGEHGKVLEEALGNRYIVPDVNALPPQDRRRFMRYIYW